MKDIELPVDFNEMIEDDLVLLSKTDLKQDSRGNSVQLKEGMRVILYEDESDSSEPADMLRAEGTVVLNQYRNKHNWASRVKWCCRINAKGIYRRS